MAGLFERYREIYERHDLMNRKYDNLQTLFCGAYDYFSLQQQKYILEQMEVAEGILNKSRKLHETSRIETNLKPLNRLLSELENVIIPNSKAFQQFLQRMTEDNQRLNACSLPRLLGIEELRGHADEEQPGHQQCYGSNQR